MSRALVGRQGRQQTTASVGFSIAARRSAPRAREVDLGRGQRKTGERRPSSRLRQGSADEPPRPEHDHARRFEGSRVVVSDHLLSDPARGCPERVVLETGGAAGGRIEHRVRIEHHLAAQASRELSPGRASRTAPTAS